MGVVQLATDRQLKRKVAIKRIRTVSQSALDRFVTEAQSIAALNHSNIVQIYEFGRDEEGPLLVLEYVSGGSLLERLNSGKLEVEDAISITCQLCDALAVAHERGIIHRDIKPANILLTEDGIPKLTDFGLARDQQADHGKTMAGAILGTIDFMAPEQREDATAVDARSDLWSLAATVYQMLTGEVPGVIDLDLLPGNLRETVATALKQNPDRRYQTVSDFRTALQGALASPVVAPPSPALEDDLADGECRGCRKINAIDRWFCSGCGMRLYEPCPACKVNIGVWERFCGKCGVNVTERIEGLAARIRGAQARQRYDDLLPVVEEYLQLRPKDGAMQELAIMLRGREPERQLATASVGFNRTYPTSANGGGREIQMGGARHHSVCRRMGPVARDCGPDDCSRCTTGPRLF